MKQGEPRERESEEIGAEASIPPSPADTEAGEDESTLSGAAEEPSSDHEPSPSEVVETDSGPPSLQREVESLAAKMRDSERRSAQALQGLSMAMRSLDDRIDSFGGGDPQLADKLATMDTSIAQMSGRMEDIADTVAAVSGDVENTRRKLEDADPGAEGEARETLKLEASIATLTEDLDAVRSMQTEADMANQQALMALKERMMAREEGADQALGKIGHAVSVIAERIDDLDTRLGDLQIDSPAPRADTGNMRDDKVAPYIANAERELQSGGGGGIDIFDKIARAAESEFDQSRGGHSDRIQSLKDDRRVGTRKWTPSKAAKRRLESMESVQAAAEPEMLEIPEKAAPEGLDDLNDTPRVVRSRRGKRAEQPEPVERAPEPAPAAEAPPRNARKAAPEPERAAEPEPEPEEDANISIVPGERGRRRDRARKSSMDDRFESVFDEDEAPSIGGLRRKMRAPAKVAADPAAKSEQGPVEENFGADPIYEDEEGNAEKGPGLFSGILGKIKGKTKPGSKSKKRSGPSRQMDPDDEHDSSMMSAFGGASYDEDDDFEEEAWEDEIDKGRSGSLTRILVLALITVAVAAGYYMLKVRGGV